VSSKTVTGKKVSGKTVTGKKVSGKTVKRCDCGADRAPGRSRCYPCYGSERKAARAAERPVSEDRVLFLDIETSPLVVEAWGLWDQNIGIHQVREPGRMICVAAKWESGGIWFGAEWLDRELMLGVIHGMLDQADTVVTYYGSRFDIPHLNRAFLAAGMPPPAPYKQVDLKQVVRRKFKFPSTKLAYVAQELGLSGKADSGGYGTWKGCLAGDLKAQAAMQKYNRQDVRVLQELYDRMLPWLPGPSLVTDGCPRCGGSDLDRAGDYRTAVSVYPRYRCLTCKTFSRGTRRVASGSRVAVEA